ncbi:hypothetical protein M8J77_021705 [Diaphorina citri]|nr:hypothetical protein M8J77_021705 [Diaphorina citri]
MSPQYPECSHSTQNVPIVPRMSPQYPECSHSTQNVPIVPRIKADPGQTPSLMMGLKMCPHSRLFPFLLNFTPSPSPPFPFFLKSISPS